MTSLDLSESEDVQKPPIAKGTQNQVLVLYMRHDTSAVMARNRRMKTTAALIEGT
jgi:hypothetical protein